MSPDEFVKLTPRQQWISLRLLHFLVEKKFLPAKMLNELPEDEATHGESALHFVVDFYLGRPDIDNVFKLVKEFRKKNNLSEKEFNNFAKECVPTYKDLLPVYLAQKLEAEATNAPAPFLRSGSGMMSMMHPKTPAPPKT